MKSLFQRWRARRERRRLIEACLDELFSRPEVFRQARLRPDHRRRVVVLEDEISMEGVVLRLRLGIVRHPKAHPMQARGEEVLEILDYEPAAATLEVSGSRNLTRRGRGPA